MRDRWLTRLGWCRIICLSTTIFIVGAQEFTTDDATSEIVESKKDFPCYSLPRENYTCSACIQFHDTCAWCSKAVCFGLLY
ncbi:unnamed protein product [Brugia timori]|uniref:PSI_integrin domain-containing protein n=1 Tax=Brugia timori TaxID=42155 RepID=A0A0R3R5V9_9BILA|nr:unnamed protein product [Brugia timori]